ncbi:MAG: S1C family serine protease, partial [Acidobacteriota bacterium]
HDDLIEFGAGGPVARFAIESDMDITPTEEVMIPDDMKASLDTSPLILKEKTPAPARTNTWLILAVVASMLMGAIAGVVLSARMSANRANFSAVAERNSPAVVFIRTEFALVDANGQTTATGSMSGSGFVISSSGLIATNRHLIQDWEYNPPPAGVSGRTLKIEVIFPGRRIGEAVTATLYKLSASKDIDVAILKINPPAGMPVVEGLEPELENITQGEEVAVIGYPLGLDLLEDRIENSLSTGVVGRVNQNLIQLNMRAYRGNSGGPALNSRGRVIGILTSNVASAEDITFCTPIAFAFDLVRGEREIR